MREITYSKHPSICSLTDNKADKLNQLRNDLPEELFPMLLVGW